jgi:hypothetical protein
MHHFFHNRLRESFANGCLKIGLRAEGVAEHRAASTLFDDRIKFVDNSVI